MSTNKTFNKVQLDVKFTQATTRANLISEENISISFGKISKYFADLHSQAFTGYTHPNSFTAKTTAGFYKYTVNTNGHVTAGAALAKSDITALGIPGSNTTYTFATGDAVGQIKVTPSGGTATNYNVKGIAAGTSSGTAKHLAYYDSATSITSTGNIVYSVENSTASTPKSRTILHIFNGNTVGNDASALISGTKGVLSYGDGGPQINFSTSGTIGGAQDSAIIWTDNDSAAAGASWHFVSSQSDWNVISKRFHARTGISIGTDLPQTSHNLYVNGTSQFNGTTTISTNAFGTQLIVERSGSSNYASLGFKNNLGMLGYIAATAADADLYHIYAGDTSKQYIILDTGNTSFTRTLSSGTKIGTIKIGGTSTDLYCQTNTNTTYTIATGDSNGQIKVTPSSGSAYNVSVKGLGSAAYTASTDYLSSSTEIVLRRGNAGKSNMNDVGRLHASVGMTDLSDPGNNYDNPMNGTTKSTSWHLYWDASYKDDPNGSNSWVAQIVNKAGTAQWWVRSRKGGTITNGTEWAAGWEHLTITSQAGAGSATNPVYIDSNGHTQACTYSLNKSVPSNAVFTDHITTVTSSGSGNAVTAISADANGALTVTKGSTFSLDGHDNKCTVTNGSTTSTNYGIVFAVNPNTTENNTLRKTNDFRYQMKDGAANTEGFATIILGNTKKLSEANNKSGNIYLYSSGGNWHLINTTSTTSNITHTLPATSGTILNSGTTSFTRTLSSGTKIGTIKINGTSTDLYCQTNTNTDTKVKVTTSTSKAYLIGTTTSPDGTAVEGVGNTGVYMTNGVLTASSIYGSGAESQSTAPTGGYRIYDCRSVNVSPNDGDKAANFYFHMADMPDTSLWWSVLHMRGWTGAYAAWEIAGPSDNKDQRTKPLYVRTSNTNTAWGSWRKIYDTSNPPTASEVGALASTTKYAASSSVGGPALSVSTAGGDVVLGTYNSSSDDSGDIVWKYGNGQEKARLWQDNTYTAKAGPQYRIYKSDGTGLYSGRLPLADGTSASGTWGISITGSAASWTTARTLTLGGQLTGSVSVKGDANMTLNGYLDRAFIYDDNAVPSGHTWDEYAWHKFAEVTITDTWADCVITFLVSRTYGSSAENTGILSAKLRTKGRKDYDSAQLKWLVRNSGLSKDDFVMVYTSTSGTSTKAELWCRLPNQYAGLIFTVLKEHKRQYSTDTSWTLVKTPDGTGSTHGSSSYPTTGITDKIISSDGTITNSTTGTATSANALNLTHGNELNFSKLASTGHVWFGYRWNTQGTETSGGTTITTYKFGNANGAGGLAGLEATTSTFKSGNFGDQLIVERTGGANMAGITFKNTNGVLGYIAANTVDGDLYHYGATDPSTMQYAILDTKNCSNYTFKVTRGSSQSTATTGYWAAMCNSTQTGSPVLPTSGKWWHVISMDWTGDDIKNWISQLAIATKDGSGVWWRRNDTGGTSINSFSWNRLAEGNSSGAATNVATEVGSTAGARPVFYAYLGDNTRVVYNTNFTYNPSGNVLTATTFAGALSGNATSANKLNTNAGATNRPVYFSGGVPVQCNTPDTGSWFGGVPLIKTDGVMEIGKYIDFHKSNDSKADYDLRLQYTGTATGKTVTLPGASGYVALLAKGGTSYYGMLDGDASTSNWIRATSNGFIPSASAKFFQTATSSLGTNSWYFNNSYIQNMTANHLVLGAAKTADGAAKGQVKFFSGNGSDATGTVTLECADDVVHTGDYTVKLPTWNGTIPIFEKLFEGASNTVSLSYSDIDEYDVFLITVANSNATSEQVTVTSLWISNVAGVHDMPLIWGGAPTSSGGSCNVTSGWIQLSKNSGRTTFVVAHKPNVAQMTSSGWSISSPTYNLYIRKIFGLKAFKRT